MASMDWKGLSRLSGSEHRKMCPSQTLGDRKIVLMFSFVAHDRTLPIINNALYGTHLIEYFATEYTNWLKVSVYI